MEAPNCLYYTCILEFESKSKTLWKKEMFVVFNKTPSLCFFNDKENINLKIQVIPEL